jgi:hypothetical protein
MGRFSQYDQNSKGMPRTNKVHPIWQGIGCLMLIAIPILSYAGAVLLVEENMTRHWLPAPSELLQTVFIPVAGVSVPHLYANLLVAFLLALLGFTILTMAYGALYSAIGPSRYGPLDAHPNEFRERKRRR